MPATAPARRSRPSITAASISCVPAAVNTAPRPALNSGSSSSATTAAVTASSALPPAARIALPASSARRSPAWYSASRAGAHRAAADRAGPAVDGKRIGPIHRRQSSFRLLSPPRSHPYKRAGQGTGARRHDPGASSYRRIRSPGGSPSLLRLVPLGLGISVVPLDTAVNIAFPDITGSFGLPIPMIQWVVICYVLTHAGLMLAFGRVGDIWGHARVFRAGLVWNIAAFLLCAAAPSFGCAAVLPLSAGDRGRADHQLRPGAGHEPVSGSAAQPRARHLHADVRDRLGERAADRRRAGRALGLACGVLVPRADRADRPVAAARAAAPRPPPRKARAALRYRRGAAAGVGSGDAAARDQRAAAAAGRRYAGLPAAPGRLRQPRRVRLVGDPHQAAGRAGRAVPPCRRSRSSTPRAACCTSSPSR